MVFSTHTSPPRKSVKKSVTSSTGETLVRYDYPTLILSLVPVLSGTIKWYFVVNVR